MFTQHSSRPPGATISQVVCQERRNKPNARSHLLHGRNRPSRDRPRFLYPTPESEKRTACPTLDTQIQIGGFSHANTQLVAVARNTSYTQVMHIICHPFISLNWQRSHQDQPKRSAL